MVKGYEGRPPASLRTDTFRSSRKFMKIPGQVILMAHSANALSMIYNNRGFYDHAPMLAKRLRFR